MAAPQDNGVYSRIIPYVWEKLHFTALVAFSACKLEELLKTLLKHVDKHPELPATEATLLEHVDKNSELPATGARRSTTKQTLGVLIDSIRSEKIYKHYDLIRHQEELEAVNELRNLVLHCNPGKGEGLGSSLQFEPVSSDAETLIRKRKEEEKDIKQRRTDLLQNYYSVICGFIPALVLLSIKNEVRYMKKRIDSKSLTQKLAQKDRNLICGYRRKIEEIDRHKHFLSEFLSIIKNSSSADHKDVAGRIEDKDFDIQLYEIFRNHSLTRLLIKAYRKIETDPAHSCHKLNLPAVQADTSRLPGDEEQQLSKDEEHMVKHIAEAIKTHEKTDPSSDQHWAKKDRLYSILTKIVEKENEYMGVPRISVYRFFLEEFKNLKDSHDLKQEDYDKLKEEYDTYEQEMEEEIERLKDSLDLKQEDYDRLKEEYDTYEEEMEEEIERLRIGAEEYRDRIEDLECEIDDLKDENKGLRQDLEKSQQKVQSLEQQIRQLTG